jgi:hypothetical protein
MQRPRTIFQRAIEHGNLTVAEATLRTEIPRPTLVFALTALIAFKQPERYSRVAARWLLKYLEAVEDRCPCAVTALLAGANTLPSCWA